MVADDMFSDRPKAISRQVSLSERVYQHLRDAIVSLHLKPCEPASAKTIAEVLGVSRTPVRDALIRLATDHLVDVFPQKVTVIAPLRIGDLKRSYFIREALEMSLVRRMASLPERSEVTRELRKAIQPHDENREKTTTLAFHRSEDDFHRLIATHAGPHGVWNEMPRVNACFDRFLHIASSMGTSDRNETTARKRNIVDAIEAGDPERAATALGLYLRGALEPIFKIAQSHPQYFENPQSFIRQWA